MPAEARAQARTLAQLLPALRDASAALASHAASPAWLTQARASALATLPGLALPDERSEAWRYTSLPELWALLTPATPVQSSPSLVPALWWHDDALPSLPAPVQLARLLDGRVQQLDASSYVHRAGDVAALPAPFARLAPGDDPFVAMNTVLTDDVLCIDVPEGSDAGTFLMHHATRSTLSGQVATRVCIRLRERAQLTLLEQLDPSGGLHNLVTEIELAPGAQLQHWRVSKGGAGTSIARTYVRLDRDAHYAGWQQLEGGRRLREELLIRLVGEGATATLAGAAHVLGRDHADLSLRIEHAASRTRSTSTYRGLAGERGRFVFKGQIHIPEGVAGIDAALANKNLLMSNDAEIDTRPELTIHADDVRCSHGATVGQLDADALFFLRARGIDEGVARALIKRAFAMAALTAMPEGAVRARAQARLQSALGGAP